MISRITFNEMQQLEQLKVIRSDNPIYQNLIQSYYAMMIQNGDLQNMMNIYTIENKELIEENQELRDELHSTRTDFRIIENQNKDLLRSVSNFLKDLKQNEDTQDELFDAGL